MTAIRSFLNFELDSSGRYQQTAADVPRLVRDFLDYKKIEAGVSELTLDSYTRGLKHFCDWLREHRTEDALHANHEDIRLYLAACWRLNLKPSTVAHRITVLREFFKHLVRDGLTSHDPMTRIAPVKQWKKLPKPITEVEIRQLLAAPTAPLKKGDPHAAKQPAIEIRDLAIVEVLYSAGLRASELTGAKLQDLGPTLRWLRVTGKGDKEGMVPLGDPAIRAVRDYLTRARPELADGNRSPYLFIGEQGKPLTRQRLWQIVGERAKRANLLHLSPHVLRHSTATHMLDHGADLRVIQTILRHADISTTECYTKVSPERLKEAVRAHHPRWNTKRGQMSLDFAPLALVPFFPSAPCIECADPSVPGKTRCARHLLLSNEASKKLRAARIAAGVCVVCGSQPLPGTQRCEEHAIAQRKASQRYRARQARLSV